MDPFASSLLAAEYALFAAEGYFISPRGDWLSCCEISFEGRNAAEYALFAAKVFILQPVER